MSGYYYPCPMCGAEYATAREADNCAWDDYDDGYAPEWTI